MWPINWWLFWSFWRKISKEPSSRHTGDTCSYGSSLWHHIPLVKQIKTDTPAHFEEMPRETYFCSLRIIYNMAHSTPCMSSPAQIWLNQRDPSHLSFAEFKYSPAMIPSTLDWPHIFVLVSTVVATSFSGERPGNGSHGGPTMVLPWSFQPRYLWPVAKRHLKVLYLVALLWFLMQVFSLPTKNTPNMWHGTTLMIQPTHNHF